MFLGANNALGSMTQLKVIWNGPGYDDLDQKNKFTVWNPAHFEAELNLVVRAVEQVPVRHVIWGTVPHVTIAPVARGVARKVREGSRYFPYYTRPWISDAEFDAKDDPNITEPEARAIDSAIDQYNTAITEAVKRGRQKASIGISWISPVSSTALLPGDTLRIRLHGPTGGLLTNCLPNYRVSNRCRIRDSSPRDPRGERKAGSSRLMGSIPPPSPTASWLKRSSM